MAGSTIDQRFDDVFRGVARHCEEVEIELRKLMDRDLAQFRASQLGLIFMIAVLSVTVGSILYCASRRKTKDLKKIEQVNRDNLEQREFLDNVLESLTYPFYVVDADDHTIKLANSAARKQGGSDKTTCHMLYHGCNKPCDGISETCPIQEVKKTRKPIQVEHTHYDKNGILQNVEVHAYPILDSAGNVTEIIEYTLDITERKRVEQSMRESEEKYKTLYDHSRDAIMLLTLEEGFFHGNQAAVELFGCKDLDEFTSRTPADLSPEKRIDGEEFYATVLLTKMELEGQHILQATVRDISALKKAEQEKKQQWDMLKITFDTAPVGMLLLEEDLSIRYVNKSVTEMVGKDVCEIIDKKPGEGLCCVNFLGSKADCGSGPHCSTCPIRQTIESVIKSGKSVNQCEVQTTLLIAENEIKPWFKISVEPVEMHGSRHAIVVLEDVTRWKQSEEELRTAKEKAEAASKAKGQFLANMSHEIRTPMNAIIGFSDLLRDEQLTETQQNYIDTIANSSHHLLQVINGVLDFSKIEAGKLDIDIEECSLRQLLSVVISMMQGLASEKGLEFAICENGDLPVNIYTDSSRLQQCLINLANNAIKFTEQGYVHINVSLQERGQASYIRFDVADTGIGIGSEKQKKIFESFTQADGSTSRKYGGTGLGLTITKQLAQLLGGELTLQSEEGKGSVFSLVIPSGLDIVIMLPNRQMWRLIR
jgi:signal transduction histidine kinase/PAS domain-containing protein